MTNSTTHRDHKRENWLPWVVAAGMGIIILFIHRPWMWHPDGPAWYDPAGHRWMLGEIRDVWSRGQLTGRTLDQSLGMPILRHYYPLVPSFSAALGWVIGDGRAIAWMATLPAVLAPLAAVWALPKRCYDAITRLLAAGGMCIIAYVDFPDTVGFPGFGFNKLSVWTGYYATAWALLLLLISAGFLYRTRPRTHVGWTDFWLGILLGLGVLAMPLVGLVMLLVAGWVFGKRWLRSLVVCGTAFSVSAWWLIPAVVAGPLEAIIHRGKTDETPAVLLGIYNGDLLLIILIPVLLAGLGIWAKTRGVYTQLDADRASRCDPILAILGVSYALVVVFYFLPAWTVWNVRFLPIWLVSCFLLSVIGVGYTINIAMRSLLSREGATLVVCAALIVMMIIALLVSTRSGSILPSFVLRSGQEPHDIVLPPIGPVLSINHNTTHMALIGGQDAGSLFYEQSPTNLFVLQLSTITVAGRENCATYFVVRLSQDFMTACHNKLLRSMGISLDHTLKMAHSLGIDWVIESSPDDRQEYKWEDWTRVYRSDDTPGFLGGGLSNIQGDLLLSPYYPSPRITPLSEWAVWDGEGSYLESSVERFRKQPGVWLVDRPIPGLPASEECKRPVLYNYNAYQVTFTGTSGCPYLIRTTWTPGFTHIGTVDGIYRAGPFMAVNVDSGNIPVRITWDRSQLEQTGYGFSFSGLSVMVWVICYLKYRQRD